MSNLYKLMIFCLSFTAIAHVVMGMYDGYVATTISSLGVGLDKTSILHQAVFDYPWLNGDLYIIQLLLNIPQAVLAFLIAWEGVTAGTSVISALLGGRRVV